MIESTTEKKVGAATAMFLLTSRPRIVVLWLLMVAALICFYTLGNPRTSELALAGSIVALAVWNSIDHWREHGKEPDTLPLNFRLVDARGDLVCALPSSRPPFFRALPILAIYMAEVREGLEVGVIVLSEKGSIELENDPVVMTQAALTESKTGGDEKDPTSVLGSVVAAGQGQVQSSST